MPFLSYDLLIGNWFWLIIRFFIHAKVIIISEQGIFSEKFSTKIILPFCPIEKKLIFGADKLNCKHINLTVYDT